MEDTQNYAWIAPTGLLIGKSAVLESSDAGSTGSLQVPINLSGTVSGKKQIVYLVFKNDEGIQGSLMVVSGIEFKMHREKPIVQAREPELTSKVRGEDFFNSNSKTAEK
ncbi:hypothetical protein P872_20290 [Rhodonellum psychrophilum GCM71 = DSM 17998]|uniref:Uncharacterized protein n=2 Tax=Rhodonellum TaxID=336827 RepID=U5BUG7_9BACT|nr:MULTISPECIES: hypothetical protein [Rhodonellum]ERM81179.1 hypothetical protein P872_20290 [Rhodonellum psychrophilum GCM71 = DSM 17998]SDZ23145.1 hypothetical protein SAMN05444412_10826 [Rhodonellum ikkaensis]